jgi:hypothetical protein
MLGHWGRTRTLPASACKTCDCACLPGPLRDRFPPSLDLNDLGEHPLHKTLAEDELLPRMQQPTRMTAVDRRSRSNRTDGRPPYHFGSRWAGRRAGWADLAQIWRGPARSGPLSFFPLCNICLINHCCKQKCLENL